MNNLKYLVTGATKGIGLAISQRLAQKGHSVIGLARDIKNVDFPGKLFSCDLLDLEQTTQTLSKISNEHEIYGIVNNAGVAMPQSLESLDLDSFYKVIDLNVRTAILVTKAFIEPMKERRAGSIVNIASRAIYGSRERTSYSAAKSALVGCTRTWALEFAPFNINVNAVAPGPVETALFRQSRPIGSDAERKILASIPMARLGETNEIASASVFFLEPENRYVTGQILSVDGGASLAGR
ncbi:NAD(P)-dependent dehydrogenase (short-subunit alcohol dehydrogenase family) [Advenella incenata]|uniref:NAD(P)-dependent dehydrogenase (Short-subunit alcohol dehydrogenase family) n=1 Tax=Advenella incenata TaxID=267800 RepID=A0A4Q7VQ65_9BURK|nr:SDR family oxidoreductase [Advenella incenata]RZT98308.1 NAD(P)-dependent dehydrogenase (short-subunit alcohol dehydrogenase family) [Advenella incenata]